ncbi:MAG: hypothetical protein OXT51_01095 [Chloroflexota bacterium]|nr:hypothetical protein [Chloroflexota bacterium]
MCKLSMGQLGGLALIVGPVMAFIMFLLQPGGAIIDTAAPSDPIAAINALADNRVMTNITVPLVILGIMIMVFGLSALLVSTRRAGTGDALSRGGLAFIIVGMLTWIWAQMMALGIAVGPDLATEEQFTGIFVARVAATVGGGMAVSLGFILFVLALPSSGSLDLWLNRLVALLSLISLASFVTAASVWGDLDQGLQLARSLYIFWVLWTVYRGVRLLREEAGA